MFALKALSFVDEPFWRSHLLFCDIRPKQSPVPKTDPKLTMIEITINKWKESERKWPSTTLVSFLPVIKHFPPRLAWPPACTRCDWLVAFSA
jgi:hypothetical protein